MATPLSAVEERTVEVYTNWMTIWTILYVVVLAVLYAYLYDWLKHLEMSGCACVQGLDFQYLKYFPIITLMANIVMLILANGLSANKSRTTRIIVSLFTLISLPALVGWVIYIAAFMGFMRRVDRERCLCVFKGDGSQLAMWTLVSQICHAFISVLFAVVMLMLVGSKHAGVFGDAWAATKAFAAKAVPRRAT